MTARKNHPLWPGDELAIAYPQGWIAYRRDRLAELPAGQADPMGCGRWCPPGWGWPPVICTDHGDGYHAASAGFLEIHGPRIIAVWLDEAVT